MNYKSYNYQESTVTKNEIGEEVKSFSTVGELIGHFYQLSGKEQYESNKDTRVIMARFHGKKPLFSLSEKGRFVVDNKNYDIETINYLNKLGYNKVEIDLKKVD